jgi:hypothetical protein
VCQKQSLGRLLSQLQHHVSACVTRLIFLNLTLKKEAYSYYLSTPQYYKLELCGGWVLHVVQMHRLLAPLRSRTVASVRSKHDLLRRRCWLHQRRSYSTKAPQGSDLGFSPEMLRYIDAVSVRDTPLLARLRDETSLLREAGMQVSAHEGQVHCVR